MEDKAEADRFRYPRTRKLFRPCERKMIAEMPPPRRSSETGPAVLTKNTRMHAVAVALAVLTALCRDDC